MLIVLNNFGCLSEGISRLKHKASVIELIRKKIINAKKLLITNMHLPPDEQ
ncbi:hypothetical protein JCM9152_1771 [Halalkalibacter hemicellulosilyticusJCM 9152]|uniref:Uncharacterized protein n=1 Tax=Halalkalibacter hemicellulosilyticusJCM 9152 TaxID=1236971 RepID=W4QE76_9BACI|nr:hypothetical protein JCM9152_1771 [Halalkalibacter hemicellulosilyticusJCM 9152]